MPSSFQIHRMEDASDTMHTSAPTVNESPARCQRATTQHRCSQANPLDYLPAVPDAPIAPEHPHQALLHHASTPTWRDCLEITVKREGPCLCPLAA
jgi:hypothetical protein